MIDENKIGVLSTLIDACNRNQVECSELISALIKASSKSVDPKYNHEASASSSAATSTSTSGSSGSESSGGESAVSAQGMVELLLTLNLHGGGGGYRRKKLPEAVRRTLFPRSSGFSTPGCVLLQSLLHCAAKSAQLYKDGVVNLPADRLNQLCRDSSASHVIQALIESQHVAYESKWKVLESLKDSLAHIALTKCGNFVIESCFRYLTPKYKTKLAQIMLKKRAVLAGHRLGLKTDYLMNLTTLESNAKKWNDWMSQTHKSMKDGTDEAVVRSFHKSKKDRKSRKRQQSEMKSSDKHHSKHSGKRGKKKGGLLTAMPSEASGGPRKKRRRRKKTKF